MNLRDAFTTCGALRVVYVRPGGNFGDQLIYQGMYRLSREIGVEFQELDYRRFVEQRSVPPDTLIYIHGGGGYVPWWSGRAYKALEHALTVGAKEVIVGPTTVHSDEGYVSGVLETVRSHLRNIDRLTFFARENTSYDVLSRVASGDFAVHINDDTALSCLRDDVIALADLNADAIDRASYVLYAIRRDAESTEPRGPSPFSCPVDPVKYCSTMRDWVLLHARAKAIVTNRLHSAIAGCVLGVPTTLLPNSYHKNRSVWEYSLQPRGVLWGDACQTSSWGTVFAVTGLTSWFDRSVAVQRMVGKRYFGI